MPFASNARRFRRARSAWFGLVVASALIGAPFDARSAQDRREPIGTTLRPASAESDPRCASSLQMLIDAAPEGSTVAVPPCIFRETARIWKPLTVAGEPGAEIRGSDVWIGWERRGDLWVSQNALPRLPVTDNSDMRCGEPTLRCLRPEQVFLDGQPLYPVGTDALPAPGEFALDGSRRVILADDPTERMVEVSTRMRWLVTAADHVTIQGFTMRHAANEAQMGAVGNDGFSHWTLQDNVLAQSHGANIALSYGTNLRVLRNESFEAGNLGLAGYGIRDSLIQGNHLHHNSTGLFNRIWNVGGLKMSEVENVIIDGNEADHNGCGLWCDGGCRNITYSANRVHDNHIAGIHFEISDGGIFRDNVAWNNGWSPVGWVWGAGIIISSSSNTEIYNNVLAWNAAGISIVDQNRPKPAPPFNHYVHDNTIIRTHLPEVGFWDNTLLAFTSDNGTGPGSMFDPASNNRGANNRYWVDQPEDASHVARFAWYRGIGRIAEFSQTPGDPGGQYMSDAEKEMVLIAHGVPLQPTANPVGADRL